MANSEDGTVLVIDENMIFKGIITIGDYLKAICNGDKNLNINRDCKIIYSYENILDRLDNVFLRHMQIRLVPILDAENKLLYAYVNPIDYTNKYYELQNAIFELKSKNPLYFYNYLVENNFNNIAIWGGGINKNLILNVCEGILEYNKKIKFSFYNLGIEKKESSIELNKTIYLESVEGIIQNTSIDVIIVMDLKFKNQFQLFRCSKIKYIDDIIYEIKEKNSYLRYSKLVNILYKLNSEKIYSINDYLIENSFTKIAIWGANDLALLIGNNLIKCNNIQNICIYDDIKRENEYKICSLNYDYDIKWIESIELFIDKILNENSVDLVIISDLNIKNLYLNNLKRVKYVDQLLYELDIKESSKRIEKASKVLNDIGVYSIYVSIPTLNRINNLRESTLKRSRTYKDISNLSEEDFNELFGEFGGKEYALEFDKNLSESPYMVKKGNLRVYPNYRSKYINYINGERFTINQPNNYNNSIYLIGSCVANSSFVEDKYTIASYLQSLINNSNLKYRVVSYGAGSLVSWKYCLNRLENIDFKTGDIVVFIDEEGYIPYPNLDMTQAFNKLYAKKEFFLNRPIHCTPIGYETIANEVFAHLNEKEFFIPYIGKKLEEEKKSYKRKNNTKVFEGNRELLDYTNEIKKLKVDCKVIGAIVMNCNPFTLGHRYLIEQALNNVDWLYIFVVEEDKSIFSFKDRLNLVKENTTDLTNITIIPSGNFIISSKTFSEYFTKDTCKEIFIDTSTDVEVFAQYIAPALNIKIRFVGEEPFDIVTNQYNKSLKSILPHYGIQLKIIPRKRIGDIAISASIVRNLLNVGDFNEIKKLVPEVTYKYLKKYHKNNI